MVVLHFKAHAHSVITIVEAIHNVVMFDTVRLVALW